MEENQTPKYQFAFMKQLNLLILVYIGIVTMCSVKGIIRDQNAQSFLNSAGKLPLSYTDTFVLGIGYYICLLLLLTFRSKNGWQLAGKIVLEILVGISICNAVHWVCGCYAADHGGWYAVYTKYAAKSICNHCDLCDLSAG